MPPSRLGAILLGAAVALMAAEAAAIWLFGWGAVPGVFVFFPFIFTWKRSSRGEGPSPEPFKR